MNKCITGAIILNDYFQWLCDIITSDYVMNNNSYFELLKKLYNTPFKYTIEMDSNRYLDGVDLCWRYVFETSNDEAKKYFENSEHYCSVLEMLIALAINIEDTFMADINYEDRTYIWFWQMIENLGLIDIYDQNYNENLVNDILDTFMNREYQPNGKNGLFTIDNCNEDLRDVEIWAQACWFFNNIL